MYFCHQGCSVPSLRLTLWLTRMYSATVVDIQSFIHTHSPVDTLHVCVCAQWVCCWWRRKDRQICQKALWLAHPWRCGRRNVTQHSWALLSTATTHTHTHSVYLVVEAQSCKCQILLLVMRFRIGLNVPQLDPLSPLCSALRPPAHPGNPFLLLSSLYSQTNENRVTSLTRTPVVAIFSQIVTIWMSIFLQYQYSLKHCKYCIKKNWI